MNLLEVEKLSKIFEKRFFFRRIKIHAVTDVSFSLQKGKVFGLVGESGCGKSTTARCIVGLERVTGGSIRFVDKEITNLSPREFLPYRRRIQMVFQDPLDALNPRYDVRTTLFEPLNIHTRLTRREKELKVLEILKCVGLGPEHLTRYPYQLSGGQVQRVTIARAIICNPELVILDEPTASLDVSVRGMILELLLGLKTQMCISYLLISHDLHVVRPMSDDVGVMYLGMLVEKAPTKILFAEPRHPYTQALLAAAPKICINGKRQKDRTLLEGEVPSPIDLPSGCFFYSRCRRAMSICQRVRPQLRLLEGEHEVACHLYE